MDGLLAPLVSRASELTLLHCTAALRQLTDLLAPNAQSTITPRSALPAVAHPGWRLLMSVLAERVGGLTSGELVSVLEYVRRLYAVLPASEVRVAPLAEDGKEVSVFGWHWRFATFEERTLDKQERAEKRERADSPTPQQTTLWADGATPFHRLLAALLSAIEHKTETLLADESALLLNCLSALSRLHPLQQRLLPSAHALVYAIDRHLPSKKYSLRYLSLISTSLFRLHRVCFPSERIEYPLSGQSNVVRCPTHQVRYQLVVAIALAFTDIEPALLDPTPRFAIQLSHILEAVCVIADDGVWDGLLESVARIVSERVRELGSYEISRLLLCFSRMQFNHDALYNSLAERLLECTLRAQVTLDVLIHSLFALVWLRRQWTGAVEKLLSHIVTLLSGGEHGLGRLRRVQQQQHAMLAWALVVVQLHPSVDVQPLLQLSLHFLQLHANRPSAATLVLLYELSLGLPAQLHAQLPDKLLFAARQRYRAYRAAQPYVSFAVEGLEEGTQAGRGRVAYSLPWPQQLESSTEALVWWVDDARYLQRYGTRGSALSEVQWLRDRLHRRHVPVVEVGWRERKALKRMSGEQQAQWLAQQVTEAEAKVEDRRKLDKSLATASRQLKALSLA